MPDVNWGILQPAQSMAPIQSATPQAPSAPAPQGNAGMLDPNEAARVKIEQQRLQMEQARQPGLIQGQQLQNQGQALQNQGLLSDNQIKAVQAQTAKEEMIHHQADLQAYKKGGIEAYATSLESHDPAAAVTLRNGIENAKETIRTHGVAAIGDTANLWHTIIPPDYNPND